MVEEKTKEEKMKDMELGDAESDIYSGAGREELIEEEDEITDLDEGFMKGYEEGAKVAECKNCKSVLLDNFVESIVDDETCRFCTQECATEFCKKNKRI